MRPNDKYHLMINILKCVFCIGVIFDFMTIYVFLRPSLILFLIFVFFPSLFLISKSNKLINKLYNWIDDQEMLKCNWNEFLCWKFNSNFEERLNQITEYRLLQSFISNFLCIFLSFHANVSFKNKLKFRMVKFACNLFSFHHSHLEALFWISKASIGQTEEIKFIQMEKMKRKFTPLYRHHRWIKCLLVYSIQYTRWCCD